MAFVPFELVKQTVTIQQGADWLKIKYTKSGEVLRGQCVHGGDARSLVITPAKQCFYCFACNAGGSVLDLVAHITKTPLRDAATALMREFIGQSETTDTVQEPKAQEVAPSKGFDAQKVLARLSYDHDAIKPISDDPAVARKLGIGVDTKGYLRGMIAIPVIVDGKISGFIGVPIGTQLKLPEAWRF